MEKTMTFVLTALIVVPLVIGVPLLLIWSLNTLFALGIDYTFWTWLAALVLGSLLSSRASKKSA